MAKKLTLRDLNEMKAVGEPITAATAYDYASIRLVEEAEIDLLVPADWGMATTLLGYPSALQATIEQVLLYVGALGRLVQHGFILAPLPFGTYQVSNEDAALNASRLMRAGADSVILEGGGSAVERVRALTEMGIPCAGHLGYLPQQVHRLGGERVVGGTAEEAVVLHQDVLALQDAGAWGVLLHNVPARVARTITKETPLITIGAGGTTGCDGQLVITHDLLGWPQRIRPMFSVQYADFFGRAVAAVNRWREEVQSLQFPTEDHTFSISEEEFEAFLKETDEE